MLKNKPKHFDCQAPSGFHCERPSFANELPESWTEGHKFWLLGDELGLHHPLSPVITKVGICRPKNKTEGLGNPLLGFLLRWS